jgi:hypothetical protein
MWRIIAWELGAGVQKRMRDEGKKAKEEIGEWRLVTSNW